MSTTFTFLPTVSNIEFYAIDDKLSEINVTSYRLKSNDETLYDSFSSTLQLGTNNKLSFTFPYENSDEYDSYRIIIDCDASVIPPRDNVFKLDINKFHVETVLSLIEAEIETLRKFNFYKCVNLQKVKATYMSNDISYAFYNCKRLTTADFGTYILPDEITELDFNFHLLFHRCESLTDFTYRINSTEFKNKLYIGSSSNLSHAFLGCNKLESMELTTELPGVDLDVAYVNLRSTFDSCISLKSLILPNKFSDVPCIHDSANMCYKCEKLKSLQGLSDTRLNLLSTKDASHMFAECKDLEFMPNLNIKASNELQKVRTVGIFNNCKKMNKVSISSDSDDYDAILATELLVDEKTGEELVDDRDILIVGFSEPNREYTMRHSFADQKRELFLHNFKGGNIIDSSYMFHGCKDVYVNKKYWQLETGYGKYGLSNDYQVKFAEGSAQPIVGGSGLLIDQTKYPQPTDVWYADITDIVSVYEDYLPLYANNVYTITSEDGIENMPRAVTRVDGDILYVYPLFKGESTIDKVSFITEVCDIYDVAEDCNLYLRYNTCEKYDETNDTYRGLITEYGDLHEEFELSSENIDVIVNRENINSSNITPFIKLKDIDPATLHPSINTSKIEYICVDSNVTMTGVSNVEKDSYLFTKRIDYDKSSYTGFDSYMIIEVRLSKLNGEYISKYFRLFRPSYSNGEGFTTSTTITDQGDVFDDFINKRYYFTEYTITAKNDTDMLSTTIEENGEQYFPYMPRLYSGDSYSNTNYESIEIFKNDGSFTEDINTLAKDVERVRIWYSEDIDAVRFIGSDTNKCLVSSLDYVNLDNITDMSHMFSNCSQLESINTTDWNIAPDKIEYMFNNCSSLQSLDLSGINIESVESLSHLFNGCSSLTELNIAHWNTSNVTNMERIFSGCTLLTTLDISGWTFSNVTDISYMFDGCISLASLDLSTWDTKNIINMDSIFNNTTNLKNVNMSNWKYDSNITIPADLFANCYIENLIIDNSDFSKSDTEYGYFVHSIDNLTSLSARNVIFGNTCNQFFRDITNVIMLDVTDCDVSLLTDMSYLFSGSTGLERLDLSTWDMTNTADMSYMFDGCSSLTELNIAHWNTSNVTNMSHMFYNCSSLIIEPVLPWNTSNVTNMSHMFYNCSSLTELDLTSWNTRNVINYDMMFSGCLPEFTVYYFSAIWTLPTEGEGFEIIFIDVANIYTVDPTIMSRDLRYTVTLYTRDNEILLTDWGDGSEPDSELSHTYNVSGGHEFVIRTYLFPTPNSHEVHTDKNVDINNSFRAFKTARLYKAIEDCSYLFANCIELESLEIFDPSSIGNTTNMQYMFYRCNKLDIPDRITWDISNVTNMQYMFTNCLDIINLDIHDWNTSSVTNIAGIFKDCTNMESVNLSDWDVSSVTNMSFAFNNCPVLNNINYSNWVVESITDISGMFMDCISLTQIDLSSWNTVNVTDMNSIFKGCTSLHTIDISTWNTDNVTDMNSMFYNCRALKSLDVSSFTASNVVNMYAMFFNCVSLTIVDLGQCYTPNLTDTSYMFHGCSALIYLDVSEMYTDNVTKMEKMFTGVFELVYWNYDNTNYGYFYLTEVETDFRGAFPWRISKKFFLSYTISSRNDTDTIAAQSADGIFYYLPRIYRKYDLQGTIDYSYYGFCRIEITVKNGDRYIDNLDILAKDVTNIRIYYLEETTAIKFYGTGIVYPRIRTLSGINAINFIDFSYMFANCSELTRIYRGSAYPYSKWAHNATITDLSYMLSNCSSLTECDFLVKEFDLNIVSDARFMLNGCSSLTYLDFREWNTASVKQSTGMLYGVPADIDWYFDGFNYISWDLSEEETNYQGIFPWNDYTHYIEYTVTPVNKLLTSSNAMPTVYNAAGSSKTAYTRFEITLNNGTVTTKTSGVYLNNIKSIKACFNRFRDIAIKFSNAEIVNVTDVNAPQILDLSNMFYNCSSLQTVNLTNLFNGRTFTDGRFTGMHGMFYNCSSLVDIEGVNNLGSYSFYIEDMSYMFYNCRSLTTLDLTYWNVSKVKDMTSMFENAGLTRLVLRYWDTGSLESATNMLKNTMKFTPKVDQWGYNKYRMYEYDNITFTEKESGYDGIFLWNYKYELNLVYGLGLETCLDVIGDFLPSNLGSYYYLVEKNGEITHNDPDVILDTSGIQVHIMYTDNSSTTFSGCLYLTTVRDYIVDDQRTSLVNMFKNCIHLRHISNLEEWNVSNITDMSHMFENCSELIFVPELNNWDTGNVTNMSYMFYGASNTSHLEESVPSDEDMMQRFISISFNTSNVTDMSYMFSKSKLYGGIFEGLDVSNVTNMSHMFDGCLEMTIADFSGWDTSNVTDMSYMFYNCKDLHFGDYNRHITRRSRDIRVSNWNTSNVTDMSYMFHNISSNYTGEYAIDDYIRLILSNWDTRNVVKSEGMLGTLLEINDWDYTGDNYTNWTLTESQTGFVGTFPWNDERS